MFHDLNLAVYQPKKDMCGICQTFQSEKCPDDETAEKYKVHLEEKELVRKIKEDSKSLATREVYHTAAIFDLQQVLYLPMSNHADIFYRRRLSVYNFTLYNLKNKQGLCQVWNETIAKRGSCEIATLVHRFLTECDLEKNESVDFFADCCSGQN